MKKKSSRSLHKSLHEAKVVVVLPKLQKAEFSLRKSIMLTKMFFLPFFVAFVLLISSQLFFVLEKDQTIRPEKLRLKIFIFW